MKCSEPLTESSSTTIAVIIGRPWRLPESNGAPIDCSSACSDMPLREVCGSDAHTYGNECLLVAENCKSVKIDDIDNYNNNNNNNNNNNRSHYPVKLKEWTQLLNFNSGNAYCSPYCSHPISCKDNFIFRCLPHVFEAVQPEINQTKLSCFTHQHRTLILLG